METCCNNITKIDHKIKRVFKIISKWDIINKLIYKRKEGGNNMKKTIKAMAIVLTMIIMLLILNTTASMAVDAAGIAGQLKGTATGASGSVVNIGNQIIGIITTVGVVVAVVVLLVLGIKYMMGSASEKAEYKKTMIPYLVGAILIFGASAITKVVVSLGANIKA